MSIEPATEMEAACVQRLRQLFTVDMLDPDDANFLDGNTYLRFARACSGKETDAIDMLHSTLKWRKQYKPYKISLADISQPQKNMMVSCGGLCKEGRPVVVITMSIPGNLDIQERIKQLVYVLEETQRKQYDSLLWIIDFGDLGTNRHDSVSRAAGETGLHLLQQYYPGRVGLLLLYRVRWYFSVFIKLARHHLDKQTQKKTIAVGDKVANLAQYVDLEQLPERVGGRLMCHSLSSLMNVPVIGERVLPLRKGCTEPIE